MFDRSTVYVTIMNKIPHILIKFFPNFVQFMAFESTYMYIILHNPPNAVEITNFKTFNIYRRKVYGDFATYVNILQVQNIWFIN